MLDILISILGILVLFILGFIIGMLIFGITSLLDYVRSIKNEWP